MVSKSSGSGSGNDTVNPNNQRKTTPRKFKVAKDNRSQKGAGKYPYYFSWKSRSGHNISLDDSQGQETVTIQHRSGTAIQMMKDGALHITAHNSRYDITFGENRMTISGAQDITVKGDASLRVYGDYNVTCHKDYNLTVMGDLNVTAKNKNSHIRGNIDTQAKNKNEKLEGSFFKMARGSGTTITKGAYTYGSSENMVFGGAASGHHVQVTDGDSTHKVVKGNMHMETKEGKFDGSFDDGQGNKVTMLAEDGKLHTKAKSDINTESEQGDIQTKATTGDIGVQASAGSVKVKAQQNIEQNATQNIRASAQQNVEVTSQAKTDIRSSGDASLHGSTTHVTAQSGPVHVVGTAGGVNIDGGSSLNLNTLAGVAMNALGLGQMQFDFGQIASAAGVPDITGQKAEQPQQEPDHTGEISQWV